MPSFEETNNPGYDDAFRHEDNSVANIVNNAPNLDTSLIKKQQIKNQQMPSFEETNNPGYDEVFNETPKKTIFSFLSRNKMK